MPPIPCAHCGGNFMRTTTDPEAPKLCNNCLLREEKRNPRKEEIMQDIVEILIKCPRDTQIEIEEYCINQGMDFTKYFLSLHETFKEKTDAFSEYPKEVKPFSESDEVTTPAKSFEKKKGGKK